MGGISGYRKDPAPDPFARAPVELARNPGRAEAKSVVVDSTRPQPRMRAHAHRASATQSISSATPTVVGLDTADFDSVGLFAPSRLAIPPTGKVTGAWLLHGQAQFVKAAGGTTRELALRRNGATTLASVNVAPDTLATLAVTFLVDDPAPGDFFELVVTQDSGGALNLTTTAAVTFFEILHVW